MTTVLLVGSWHFAEEEADPPEAELDEVVARLAGFEPTKVAVEIEHHRYEVVDEAYSLFCKGEWTARNEAVQLGFRLARRCGLSSVVPIDVVDHFWEPAIEDVAHRRPDLQEHYEAVLMAALGVEHETDGTVAGRLRALNQPEAVAEVWAPYIGPLLAIAEGDDYPGADILANWWRRNLKIAVNLRRCVGADDRVAVVYGAGHVPVLQRILADMPGMELVDPLEWL